MKVQGIFFIVMQLVEENGIIATEQFLSITDHFNALQFVNDIFFTTNQ